MRFDGVIPPVTTPFKADLSIDWDGFRVMIEHLISSGVDGIIVGGTTGEYYAQTREERIASMKTAREAIKGRVPMIVGVGAAEKRAFEATSPRSRLPSKTSSMKARDGTGRRSMSMRSARSTSRPARIVACCCCHQ